MDPSDKKKYVEYFLLGIFAFGAVIAVVLFSLSGKAARNNPGGGFVTIWGTYSTEAMAPFIEKLNNTNKDLKTFYVPYRPETFDTELVEALAAGRGPDIILYTNDSMAKYLDKVSFIPYDIYPERSYQSLYADATYTALIPHGIAALPLGVDPMVMYYNRDTITSAFLTAPPLFWDEIFPFAKSVTVKDGLVIKKSAIALGGARNVRHGKDIIALLSMQAGSAITGWRSGSLSSVLDQKFASLIHPFQSAITYYVQFANTGSEVYTWNASLANSFDVFVSGDLALYLGYASEFPRMRERNPNLNYDVAYVPQLRDSGTKFTIARSLLASVMRNSGNPTGSFTILYQLADPAFNGEFVKTLGFQPARRDLLSVKATNAYDSIFLNSVIISRGWIDPSPADTAEFFGSLITQLQAGTISNDDVVDKSNRDIAGIIHERIRLAPPVPR